MNTKKAIYISYIYIGIEHALRPVDFFKMFISLLFLVSNYNFDKSKQCIGAMMIEIDFLQKKSTDSSPYDSDKMANEFIQQFNNQSFTVGQQVQK